MWVYAIVVCLYAPDCLPSERVTYRSPEAYSSLGECFTASGAAQAALEAVGKIVIENGCGLKP